MLARPTRRHLWSCWLTLLLTCPAAFAQAPPPTASPPDEPADEAGEPIGVITQRPEIVTFVEATYPLEALTAGR